MPLTVFENYLIDGNGHGYPQEHWDAVIEEYDNLTGEKGGSDAKFNIGRHTELVVQLNAWSAALDGVESLFNQTPKVYAASLCLQLASRFKGLSFSKETLLKDIDIAKSKLKTNLLQIKELQELLPTEEQSAINQTFFDEIIFAYREVIQAHFDKDTATVQQFALAYKRLKERIELESRKNKSVHG